MIAQTSFISSRGLSNISLFSMAFLIYIPNTSFRRRISVSAVDNICLQKVEPHSDSAVVDKKRFDGRRDSSNSSGFAVVQLYIFNRHWDL